MTAVSDQETRLQELRFEKQQQEQYLSQLVAELDQMKLSSQVKRAANRGEICAPRDIKLFWLKSIDFEVRY